MDTPNTQGETLAPMDSTPTKSLGEVESDASLSNEHIPTQLPAVLVTSPSTNELEDDSEESEDENVDTVEGNRNKEFESEDRESFAHESTSESEIAQNIIHDVNQASQDLEQLEGVSGLVMKTPEVSSPGIATPAQEDSIESYGNEQKVCESKNEDYVVIGASDDAKIDYTSNSADAQPNVLGKSQNDDKDDLGQSLSAGTVGLEANIDSELKRSQIASPEDQDKLTAEHEEAAVSTRRDEEVLGSVVDENVPAVNALEESEAQDKPVDLTQVNDSTPAADSDVLKPVKDSEAEPANLAALPDTTESSGLEPKKEEPSEWLDILGNGLLRKKVLVPGKGRETRPVNGQEVTISVKGKLEDGMEVDCHEELSFQLGDEDAIIALELAVALMEDGEKAIVVTDSKYAYGKFGRPNYEPAIPPNAKLEYELELLSIKEGREIGSLTPEQQLKIGNEKRMKGNYLYVLGDYDAATSMYTRGIKYVEGSSDKEVADLCTKIWNNLSAAQLKMQAYKAALNSCEMVLRAEPENMKGYFRKGKCLEGMNDMEEALKCFKQASMLEPQNKLILQELGRVKAKVVNSQKKEREMYQRMMQGSGKNSDADDEAESSGSWYPYLIFASVVAAGSVLVGYLWTRPH